jgi:hypothetical protein
MRRSYLRGKPNGAQDYSLTRAPLIVSGVRVEPVLRTGWDLRAEGWRH